MQSISDTCRIVSRRQARRLLSCTTALALGLAACSSLPAAGPTSDQVKEGITQGDNPLGIRMVDLSPNIVQAINTARGPSLSDINKLRTGRPLDLIGPGDVLSITLYEAGPGLFSSSKLTNAGTMGEGSAAVAAASGGGGTSAENLPRMLVDRRGMITLPYVGDLKVSGRSPFEVQKMIESRLADKASQPQAMVAVLNSDTNVVFVSGDLKNSGRVPLTLAGENVLDVVALAGGPTHSPQDTLVRVTRRGQSAQTSLNDVQMSDNENIRLEPQDRIQVDYRPRTYLVFGAMGKVAQIPFDQVSVSLAEAIARTGGLDDQRANPESVFLFRYEKPSIAQSMGLKADKAQVPVIYHVNMRDPQNFFLLQKMAMQDKDLIYVANAGTVQVYKFLQLINTIIAPAIYGRALAG